MKHIRIALLTTLLLLPATRVWAQAYDAAGPRELYHAEVCNEGRITVDVAVAYKDFGFSDEFWIVDYWYQVAPGKCKLVYRNWRTTAYCLELSGSSNRSRHWDFRVLPYARWMRKPTQRSS